MKMVKIYVCESMDKTSLKNLELSCQKYHFTTVYSPAPSFQQCMAILPVVSSSEPLREYFCTCTKESGSKSGAQREEKEGTMRPAGGLQTNRAFFAFHGGTIRLFLRRWFCSGVSKDSVTAETRKGDFARIEIIFLKKKSRQRDTVSEMEFVCAEWR